MLQNIFKPTNGPIYNKLFWTQGYLHFPKFFNLKDVTKIKKIINDIETSEKYKEKYDFSNDDVKIENIINYNKELKELVDDKITPTIQSIYQHKMVLFNDKIIWRQSFSKGFNAQQDNFIWKGFPLNRFVTISFCSEFNTIKSGCYEFSPKNHIYGILESEKNSNKINSELEKLFKWKPIETTPHDLLIYDSYLPYRCKSNKTSNCKRIFNLMYNLEDESNFYNEYIN